MKKFFIRKILFLTMISVNMLLVTTSCSSDDTNDYIPGGSGGTTELKSNYFTVFADGKSYVYPITSGVEATNPSGDADVATLYSEGSGYDNEYGIYKGGYLSITYTLQGEGTYVLVSDNELAAVRAAESNEKVISIKVVLGSSSATLYQTFRNFGGTAQVTIINGKYHFSIENSAIFEKTLSTGDSGEQMSQNIGFTANDVYWE